MKRTVFICGVLFFSTNARAWTLVAPNLTGWETTALTFRVNPTGCPISEELLNSVVDQAIASWNAIPTSGLTLSRDSVASTETVTDLLAGTAAGVPLIACDTNFSGNNEVDPDGVPGGTIFGSGTTLRYSGIILNAEAGTGAEISNFSEARLVIILAHEIGHVLGLGHTSDSDALMYFSIAGKETPYLAQDDRDGMTYLYPRNEFAQGALGCGIRPPGTTTAGERWGVLATWLLGFLGLLLGRGVRRYI